MQNSLFLHAMTFSTGLGQQPCAAGSLPGTQLTPWPPPRAQPGAPARQHRESGWVPTAGTKGLVAMPWGVHPGQLIAFGVPVCSCGARSRAGDEGQQAMAMGTMWPSSGPNSDFPSRSFWSSIFFFQGELWHRGEGFPPRYANRAGLSWHLG